MLAVSLDCPFLIGLSVFYNVHLLGINAPKLAIVSTNHVIPYLAHVLLVDVNMDI
jgi:hypothetical protein